MVSADIISDCIVKAKQYGTGLAAMRCQETIIRTGNSGKSGCENIDRWKIMRVQTPQAYKFGTFLWVHEEAVKRGISDAVYTNTIMVDLGEEVYFSLGSDKNLKITTLDDIDMFKALYKTKRDEWLK
jgi:2-C-methyl-D-erythritol 4-phosphate cytidylyltransferase